MEDALVVVVGNVVVGVDHRDGTIFLENVETVDASNVFIELDELEKVKAAVDEVVAVYKGIFQ